MFPVGVIPYAIIIKNNREIIYVGVIWKVIMLIISLIPEKIFKRLK